MSIALRLSLTFVKFLFAIVLFVFVYKGKNFYRGSKRGSELQQRRALLWLLSPWFVWGGCGREGLLEVWVCGVGGWFLGGGWLRFGEEWSRNEKVFARSVRVFWARSEESLRRKGVPYLPSLPFPSEVCSLVSSWLQESRGSSINRRSPHPNRERAQRSTFLLSL